MWTWCAFSLSKEWSVFRHTHGMICMPIAQQCFFIDLARYTALCMLFCLSLSPWRRSASYYLFLSVQIVLFWCLTTEMNWMENVLHVQKRITPKRVTKRWEESKRKKSRAISALVEWLTIDSNSVLKKENVTKSAANRIYIRTAETANGLLECTLIIIAKGSVMHTFILHVFCCWKEQKTGEENERFSFPSNWLGLESHDWLWLVLYKVKRRFHAMPCHAVQCKCLFCMSDHIKVIWTRSFNNLLTLFFGSVRVCVRFLLLRLCFVLGIKQKHNNRTNKTNKKLDMWKNSIHFSLQIHSLEWKEYTRKMRKYSENDHNSDTRTTFTLADPCMCALIWVVYYFLVISSRFPASLLAVCLLNLCL